MGDGPPTTEFEDGTVDVERLLVEPQDGHVSVDSVLCSNEKISEKAIDIREVSCGFGATSTGTPHEGGDILNRDVLDSFHAEDDSGYFRLQNDFCSMGEEYLLENCCIGYASGFAESITDLEYVSSECLQTSVSDGPVLTCAGIDSPWKADLFRIMEVPECQNDVVDLKSSGFGEIPNPKHRTENLAEKKPLKLPEDNIGKVHEISSHSFDDVPSDENTASLSQSLEMLSGSNDEKNDEYGQSGQNGESIRVQKQNAMVTLSYGESQSDAIPTLKRSRKPTRRYIDEVVDPISRPSKKRREISSSTFRDKLAGVKDNKKCHVGSKAIKLPDEESAVKAIQVPFGSLVPKECPQSPAYNLARSSDRRNMINKSKDNYDSSENQKKRDEYALVVHQKERDEYALVVHQMERTDGVPAAGQKKDDNVNGAHSMKRDQYATNIHLTKRNDRVMARQKKKDKDRARAPSTKINDRLAVRSQKTREQTAFGERPKKKDEYAITIYQECPTVESPEEAGTRRKHHRLWTIAEVKKLIDGVAEYGVGRWSRIKKIYFHASAHRTSVDLKDKWRNLLKASGLQGKHSEHGEKKRNVAWRPLPKSMLRRVRELAAVHPYPKGGKSQHINHASPDRSTDITLNDYRRILRSINGT